MSVTTTNKRRLLFPGLAGLYDAVSPFSWTLMRLSLGLILMPHGFGKLFGNDLIPVTNRMVALHLPFPTAFGLWIGILEFFGGLMLALGLFTRVIAAMVAFEMAVICFLVLWPVWGWSHGGMEYALMMGLFALAFAFGGSGRCALDRLLPREV